jgi:hypothetical protein
MALVGWLVEVGGDKGTRDLSIFVILQVLSHEMAEIVQHIFQETEESHANIVDVHRSQIWIWAIKREPIFTVHVINGISFRISA